MGVYYEMFLACDLQQYAPQQVIDVLDFIANPSKEKWNALVKPQHPFFQMDGWESLTQDVGAFQGTTFALLTQDKFKECYSFTTRMTIKRDYEVLQAFVEWIWIYTQRPGFVGYLRSDMHHSLTLIEFGTKQVYYRDAQLRSDLWDE